MKDGSNNSFPVRAKVLLEGVEVPYYSLGVSYGINEAPTCTIVLQASSVLRSLPEDTRILIIYQEPGTLPNSEWYVLFDGELASMNYSMDANGATMTITGGHASASLDLVQLLIQPMASIANLPSSNDALAGANAVFTVNGLDVGKLVLADILFNKKELDGKVKSMSDLVFAIIHLILNKTAAGQGIESTKFYREKVIENYKVPERIANVNLTEAEIDTVAAKYPISLKK